MADFAYQPYIDDPEHIRAVEGERYVVLRLGTPLSGVHDQLQGVLRRCFADQPISYPVGAHVTLAGVGVGTSLGGCPGCWRIVVSSHLRFAGSRWKGSRIFPTQQIVFVQVLKTPELLDALSQLRRVGVHLHGVRCGSLLKKLFVIEQD